jgi:hypothetical protein
MLIFKSAGRSRRVSLSTPHVNLAFSKAADALLVLPATDLQVALIRAQLLLQAGTEDAR